MFHFSARKATLVLESRLGMQEVKFK